MSMPLLLEARSLEEDWTGLKDAKARRKLQNRLNVRAHRKRKLQNLKSNKDAKNQVSSPLTCLHEEKKDCVEPATLKALAKCLKPHNLTLSALSKDPDYNIMESPYVIRFILATSFPMTSDHLMPLLQFNLIRAMFTNLTILGLLHTVPMECRNVAILAPSFPFPQQFPEALRPTLLQQKIPHNPWLDMLPDPQMRDNALELSRNIDVRKLLTDLVGGLCCGENSVESNGILVWKEPWSQDGWEMSEGFIRNWSGLLKGCSRMLEATNKYRMQRGEHPLVLEL